MSAFDHVLSPGIPDKGVLLTTLSLWWFDRLAGSAGGRGIPNHRRRDHVLEGEDAVELIRMPCADAPCSSGPSTCSRSSASCAAT